MRKLNLKGQRFGRLLVTERAPSTNQGTCWHCTCDCGAYVIVGTALLQRGKTKSCGCYRRDRGVKHGSTINLRHGEGSNGKETPEYRAWTQAKSRCHNENHSDYKNYGARGIRMCERWRSSYEKFLAAVGRRPSPTHSLDRRDNDGNYEPDNCRWATSQEQNRNNRNTRIVTIGKKTKALGDWLDETGTSRTTFYNRIRAGFTEAEAIFLPRMKRNREPL